MVAKRRPKVPLTLSSSAGSKTKPRVYFSPRQWEFCYSKYSQVHQNRLEGVCELQCQGLSFCAFEKTWEIRNRSTTISFSHLNPFQSFLNSFVLSLNRQRRKKEFLCSFAQYIVWVLPCLSPSPGMGTATFWDAKRENQVCHFSCIYPLLLSTKKPSVEREEMWRFCLGWH